MDKSMTKITFLGLGVMGYPMAGHLVAAGHSVTVYNRTTAKAEAWVAQHGGALGKTPADAAEGAEMVMACVGNDDDLRSVCLSSDGAFASMREGSTFVDHTTVSAAVTRELYESAKAKGISFVDAPVSGGQAGAENGQLSIMCGGDQKDYDWAEPVMNVYSKLCRRIGDSGSGQMTKMCNHVAATRLPMDVRPRHKLRPVHMFVFRLNQVQHPNVMFEALIV
jgi:3-hydroxyisobutyrate dehydrogenase